MAIRERSAAELRQRLIRRGFDPRVAADVLEWCRRLDYVNDERFVEEWIRSRLTTRPSGRRRLEQELRQKGVDLELARRKLDQLLSDQEEQTHCQEVARKLLPRYQSLPADVRRRRLGALLLRRGFAPEAVQDALGQVDTDSERH